MFAPKRRVLVALSDTDDDERARFLADIKRPRRVRRMLKDDAGRWRRQENSSSSTPTKQTTLTKPRRAAVAPLSPSRANVPRALRAASSRPRRPEPQETEVVDLVDDSPAESVGRGDVLIFSQDPRTIKSEQTHEPSPALAYDDLLTSPFDDLPEEIPTIHPIHLQPSHHTQPPLTTISITHTRSFPSRTSLSTQSQQHTPSPTPTATEKGVVQPFSEKPHQTTLQKTLEPSHQPSHQPSHNTTPLETPLLSPVESEESEMMVDDMPTLRVEEVGSTSALFEPETQQDETDVPGGFSAHSRFLATQAGVAGGVCGAVEDNASMDDSLEGSFIDDDPVSQRDDAEFVQRSLSSQCPAGFSSPAKVRAARRLFGKTAAFSLFYNK